MPLRLTISHTRQVSVTMSEPSTMRCAALLISALNSSYRPLFSSS
jgi:hypothetical protein